MMSSPRKPRRWPRFVAYLPVQCTVLSYGKDRHRTLGGTTLNVGAGGVACLLPETFPLGISLLVQVGEEEPMRGTVVWTDRRVRTLLGSAVPHGVAFEMPVDLVLVRQWLSQAKRRVHERALVAFPVECALEGKTAPGQCLNLSHGGMFVALEAPPEQGTEIGIHFTLPGVSDLLAVRGRIAWVVAPEADVDTTAGMGVQFIDLSPLEAALIDAFVNRLLAESAPPQSAPSFPATSR
jgi:uncharacterized protein (TIGR02266 family)